MDTAADASPVVVALGVGAVVGRGLACWCLVGREVGTHQVSPGLEFRHGVAEFRLRRVGPRALQPALDLMFGQFQSGGLRGCDEFGIEPVKSDGVMVIRAEQVTDALAHRDEEQ